MVEGSEQGDAQTALVLIPAKAPNLGLSSLRLAVFLRTFPCTSTTQVLGLIHTVASVEVVLPILFAWVSAFICWEYL